MSTALLSAPKTYNVEDTVIKPKKAFKDKHRDAVQKDCSDAQRKRNAKRLVITPQRVNHRYRPDRSSVCVDLTANCRELRWLKKLYREECPDGMSVRFDFENHLDAACGDHLEDIYMLVVIFDEA